MMSIQAAHLYLDHPHEGNLPKGNAALSKSKSPESVDPDFYNASEDAPIASVFVDSNLKMRCYTPGIAEILPLHPSDAGRFIADFLGRFENRDLLEEINKVRQTLKPRKFEYRDLEAGAWWMVQLAPCCDPENAVNGIAISFLNRYQQKKEFAGELLQAERHERRKFSKLLHDHLQQMIVAAKMILRKIQIEKPQNDLDEVIQILDDAITHSQSLAMEISPPFSFHRGMRPALEWLVKWALNQYRLKVNLQFSGNDRPFPEPIGYFILEATKELLLNVVKYAEIDRAEIGAEFHPQGSVRLWVKDGGKGFQADRTGEASLQFGLLNIRERIDMLGGSCAVESSIGKGSKVILNFPAEVLDGVLPGGCLPS